MFAQPAGEGKRVRLRQYVSSTKARLHETTSARTSAPSSYSGFLHQASTVRSEEEPRPISSPQILGLTELSGEGAGATRQRQKIKAWQVILMVLYALAYYPYYHQIESVANYIQTKLASLLCNRRFLF